MNDNNYLVLMAGGSGTRLWPISRESKPKQFHRLTSDKSLLQETFERTRSLVAPKNIFVSLGQNTLKETQRQLKKVPKENYIIEPQAKNTAPAIALVAAKIFKINPGAIIATISTDHTVNNVSNYQRTFEKAFNFVKSNPDYLVTVGILPDRPETGYGYIKLGRKFSNEKILAVDKFVEKPDFKTAKKYLDSGNYLWNASYFIFRADGIIKMFELYASEIYRGLKNIIKTSNSFQEQKVIEKEFERFPKIPIDIALAEKVKKIAVIPAQLGWSDVGNWSALHDLLCKGNPQVIAKGQHVGIGDKNCLFFAHNRLLATVGLENIVIVNTPDVTLVCHKDKAQEVKLLIEKLKKEGKTKYL